MIILLLGDLKSPSIALPDDGEALQADALELGGDVPDGANVVAVGGTVVHRGNAAEMAGALEPTLDHDLGALIPVLVGTAELLDLVLGLADPGGDRVGGILEVLLGGVHEGEDHTDGAVEDVDGGLTELLGQLLNLLAAVLAELLNLLPGGVAERVDVLLDVPVPGVLVVALVAAGKLLHVLVDAVVVGADVLVGLQDVVLEIPEDARAILVGVGTEVPGLDVEGGVVIDRAGLILGKDGRKDLGVTLLESEVDEVEPLLHTLLPVEVDGTDNRVCGHFAVKLFSSCFGDLESG